mgnify:CR=1 FL=1|jgi:quercetin dioxygenase-like cupin family protein
MKHDDLYYTLLRTTQAVYTASSEMMAFRRFPHDIKRQTVTPYHCSCSDIFRDNTSLSSNTYTELQDAIRAAGQVAHWRATYKNTDIGDNFMNQFGCYCIIGENGPFSSDAIRLYMVYMPPHLYYPWHNHPAEEIYMLVSGSAVFKRMGLPDKTLAEGDTSFHEGNQPHAMETLAEPVLCLAAWRNQFQNPPIWTAAHQLNQN